MTTINFDTRLLHGKEVRMYFTARGKLRFIIEDLLEALIPSPGTKPTLKMLQAKHILPLSPHDDTPTIDWLGMNSLALNTRRGMGLQYVDFLKSLPRQSK